ncbi:MAG: DUF2142 domain-containing protein [Candidatus Kapabacteria bacterium]|nr:DUF2142 domain-containing protein [Ignavibacteriota bacterium]MCW5885261.1 DUF2142 domain-containing protein [Candidatus Kapabacteria bacterium]
MNEFPKSIVKEEYIFALLALLFGVLFLFLTPPFSSDNEYEYFVVTYAESEFSEVLDSDVNNKGFFIPQSIKYIYDHIATAKSSNNGKVPNEIIDDFAKLKLHPDNKVFYNYSGKDIRLLNHLPAVFGIWIGKIINPNPIYLVWLSRISQLLVYIIIIFFAIKITPLFKKSFLLISLFPAVVFNSVVVNTYILGISLAILFISIIFKITFDKENSSVFWLVALLIIALILRFSSDIYIILLLIPVVIPTVKLNHFKVKIVMIAAVLLVIFLPMLISGDFLLKDFLILKSFQNGFIIDGDLNLAYHSGDLFNSFKLVIQNIVNQGGIWMKSAVAGILDSNLGLPEILVFVTLIIVFASALFDRKIQIQISVKFKLTSVVVFLTSILFITTYFLIFASPVGSNRVENMISVLFVPLLLIMLTLLNNDNYQNDIFDKYGSIIIGVWALILLVYFAQNIATTL